MTERKHISVLKCIKILLRVNKDTSAFEITYEVILVNKVVKRRNWPFLDNFKLQMQKRAFGDGN